ncbi:MAG: metallophosphoesterase [Parabacteroides sp.]|nr:metallophosphoesterase [Parabacteroides sp.]
MDGRADEVVSAIEQMEDYEAFFWITDIHWEPDLNTRCSPAMIRYLADRTGIDKILNGGDTGNSSVICTNAINRLRDAIGSNKVYSVNGNHEINDASRYEKPFIRVHKALREHCSDIVYGDKNKSYFYRDDTTDKVRYIGLSTYGLFIGNQYESAYTDE